MALPEWNGNGLLPPGIYPASMSDIYERFVEDAPQRDRREILFSALSFYMTVMERFVPSGRAWIDGGFGTQKGVAPHDVDVVVLPADWNALGSLPEEDHNDFLGLLTLQDIIIGSFDPPEWWARLQPIGGALDGFVCQPGSEAVWEGTWSSVKGDDGFIIPGVKKGFVEVTW